MPMVGGKKFPYTKKGVAAAKKVAAEKREATQKSNRGATMKRRDRSQKVYEANLRLGRYDYGGEPYGEEVSSNRIKSKGWKGDVRSDWVVGVSASDSLKRGSAEKAARAKKTRSAAESAARAKARRAGAR